MNEPAIIVDGLGKRYHLGPTGAQGHFWRRFARDSVDRLRGRAPRTAKIHWALKDVSFTVRHGERVGIIGRNGAGKSTLLKILSRVVYPTTGRALIRGRLTSLLEVGTGFNDNLSGRENVFLNASLYGLTRPEIEERFDDIVAFSEIGRFIDTPVKNYSSGMRMRLAFSVAAHLDPDILLLDEVLAVGDMSFQRKCLERVDDLTSGGRTLFFVSHSMDAIVRYCDRCLWLDDGSVRADGDVQAVVSQYVEAVLKVRPRRATVAAELPTASQATFPATTAQPNLAISAGASPLPSSEGGGVSGEAATLLEAKIISSDGQLASLVLASERVGVQFSYRVFRQGIYTPTISLQCPQGTLVFWSVPPSRDIELYRLARGDYSAIAWIPGDLLNVGTYTVTVGVVDPSAAPMQRHFVHEQILSFHCVDSSQEDGASGILPRRFPGPLRPRLDWTMEARFEMPLPRFLTDRTVKLSVDTSGFCNARCAYCPWPMMEKSRKVMDLDGFRTLLDRFENFRFEEFALNSINEPFADRTILDKLEILIGSGLAMDKLFFSSNWLLPKPDQIDRFVGLVSRAVEGERTRSVSVNATISGIDHHTYDNLQAGRELPATLNPYRQLDFDKAKANVVALARRLADRVPGAPVVLNIKAYGFLFSVEEYRGFWQETLREAGVDERFLSSRVKILLNHGFTSFARSDHHDDDVPRRCTMNWLWKELVVGPGLDVGLCCHEGAHAVTVGNLGTSSLAEIVAGEAFREQYRIVSGQERPGDGHPCSTCEFYLPDDKSG